MRRDSRLRTITEALQTGPGTNRRAHRIWGRSATAGMDDGAFGNVWAADVHDLARHVYTRLYGRPDTTPELSPLAQADEAKRARDLGAEVSALNDAYTALTTAPWYPARAGDLVHIHYEATPTLPAFGETYVVADAGDGLSSMQFLTHTCSGEDRSVGCIAVEASDDVVCDAWFEAGPHRLTIVRDGRPVHIGGAR